MSPDNANAIGMIAMLLTTMGLIFFFGKLRQQVPWGKRIGIALLAGFLILVFTSIGFGYKCPSSYFTTGYRSNWFSICAIAIALFMPNRTVILVSCLAIIMIGFKLNVHYDYLVNKTGTYGYLAANGRAYNCACPEESSGGVKVKPLWHSRLTEVYLVD